jgi:hypothetical protein
MITHPTAAELLRAVAGYLDAGEGGGYLALVARNAVAIVQREIELAPAADARAAGRLRILLGSDQDLPVLEARLAAALRDGSMGLATPGVFEHLKLQTLDRLAIDQPRYRHELGGG